MVVTDRFYCIYIMSHLPNDVDIRVPWTGRNANIYFCKYRMIDCRRNKRKWPQPLWCKLIMVNHSTGRCLLPPRWSILRRLITQYRITYKFKILGSKCHVACTIQTRFSLTMVYQYLDQCWPSSVPPYGVTSSQWVNVLFPNAMFSITQYISYKGATLI